MGLFDFFAKPKKEVQNTNKIKVLFVTDYGKYKAGEVAEVDKSEVEYLVSGCFASTNINANVVEEKKRLEAEREKRLNAAVDNTIKEIHQGKEQAQKAHEEYIKTMTEVNQRLGNKSTQYTDLGIKKAREIVNEEKPKEIETEPQYIPYGAQIARRLLKEIEEEKRKKELDKMIGESKVDSSQKGKTNIK